MFKGSARRKIRRRNGGLDKVRTEKVNEEEEEEEEENHHQKHRSALRALKNTYDVQNENKATTFNEIFKLIRIVSNCIINNLYFNQSTEY